MFAYHGSEPYLPSSLKSLSEQTDQDFDVFIFNDNSNNLMEFCDTFLNKTAKIKNVCGSIAVIRSSAFRCLKKLGYANIIFGDVDDVFDRNRVEVTKKLLTKNDLVVNDLDVCDENLNLTFPTYFQRRILTDTKLNVNDLRSGNFIGFTNSAVRGHMLPDIDFSDNLIGVDWSLFTYILQSEPRAIFTGATSTKYRVHCHSHSDLMSVDAETIRFQIDVKLRHFEFLSKHFPGYDHELDGFKSLKQKVKDTKYFEGYLQNVIGGHSKFPFWWEAARLENHGGAIHDF